MKENKESRYRCVNCGISELQAQMEGCPMGRDTCPMEPDMINLDDFEKFDKVMAIITLVAFLAFLVLMFTSCSREPDKTWEIEVNYQLGEKETLYVDGCVSSWSLKKDKFVLDDDGCLTRIDNCGLFNDWENLACGVRTFKILNDNESD